MRQPTLKQLFSLAGLAFLLSAISFGFNFLNFSGAEQITQSQIPLGVWQNMPPSTSCDLVSANVSASVCELMGNVSSRATLFTIGGFSGYSAALSIGCLTPSTGPGSLQLQYALYSQVTELNTTNFQSIASPIILDGVTNPCPGEDVSGSVGNLNTTTALGYIFRVIGANGGGPGDNPRFSHVSVLIQISQRRVVQPTIATQTVSSFTTVIVSSSPVVGNTAFSFRWIATNASSTIPSCGSNLLNGNVDVCWQKGTNSCTILAGASSCSVTTTYTTAFTGSVQTVANVLASSQVWLSVGSLDLLREQTVTA